MTPSTNIKLLFISLVLCTFTLQDAFAYAKKEFVKTIQKEFPINAEGKVSLENKYGNVDIKTWNQNQVAIKVTIIVDARSEEVAQTVFDRIDIGFHNTASLVNAVTTIADASSSSSWTSWLFGGGSNDNNSEFKIHYDVMMPQTNQLDLKNKYGDSYVGVLDGSTKVEIKYGSIKMDGIHNDLDIMLGYGNATIPFAKNMSINVKYSTVELQEAANIEILSKYSTIELEQIGDLNSTSKYDKYNIGIANDVRNEGKYDKFRIDEVQQISADAKYSNYRINKLIQAANFDLGYGGASIEHLADGFSKVDIVGRYADFDINVGNTSNYKIDIHTTYSDLDYPLGMNVVHEEKDDFSHKIEANSGQNSGGLIKARLNYGGIEIE